MKNKHLLLGIVFALLPSLTSTAQTEEEFEQFRARKQAEFNHYREEKRKAFEEFRRQRNEEFAKYICKKWKRIDSQPVLPKPKDDTVPPVVKPHDDPQPVTPPPTPKPRPYDEVIPAPSPTPQPQPIDPIEEQPEPSPVRPTFPTQSFSFFGTPGTVRIDKNKLVRLRSLNENAIADAWLKLSEEYYTNLIYDCLQIRKEHTLCDWAYLMMLKQMSEAVYGKHCNESELLMAYVYCQSGYKMRLATQNGKLLMLFASKHTIYDWTRYVIDGEYYYGMDRKNGDVMVCAQKYPKEQSLSLLISTEQQFALVATTVSTHQSKRDADMKVSLKANKNLLDFYTSYPTSMIGNNMVSRWAMYANTPMSSYVRQQVYPAIKSAISHCDQWTAVNKILNFVQTGFVYEYDDKVWGDDRAFFAEESLHYPYCDCEDRSILLTRIIRDLLGLKCILIFYPGHLAAAVEFTEGNPVGDCIVYNGRRFFIADGTILGYGAPVGETMEGMDNKTAKVILLEE